MNIPNPSVMWIRNQNIKGCFQAFKRSKSNLLSRKRPKNILEYTNILVLKNRPIHPKKDLFLEIAHI